MHISHIASFPYSVIASACSVRRNSEVPYLRTTSPSIGIMASVDRRPFDSRIEPVDATETRPSRVGRYA
jgi:hypothetical protein